MKRGDIYWVTMPAADGHEQKGTRPVVVLQDEKISDLPVVLVVPLTGSLATLRFSGTFKVEPTPENALAKTSVALVFQTRAIDRRRLTDRIGNVDDRCFTEILHQLDKLLGREDIASQ